MSSSNTTSKTRPVFSAGTKLAVDFGPLLLFFLVNMFAPVSPVEKIFVATGAFMLATVVAMIWSKLVVGSISPMLWFNGAMVVVFGGITLWLHHDDTFIKVKPTIYYVMLSGILFFGLFTGKPTLKIVLGPAYPGLTERGWLLLSRNWAWFFAVMAVINEAAWRNMTTDAWVAFKLWAVLPATILYALANVPLLMRHGMGDDAAEAELAQVPPEG